VAHITGLAEAARMAKEMAERLIEEEWNLEIEKQTLGGGPL
jgi:hypothetical protein